MQQEEQSPFLDLDNKTIGRKIYLTRKIAGLKANDVAERLGLGEAAYTKYERGETNITVEFIKKIAVVFNIDPIQLLSTSEGHFFENVHNSPILSTFHTFQTTNEKQNQAILTLIDNVVEMNKRIMELLEKKL
ncbi:MAG: helix-turn-helix transcriptional regulator [Mucilaginibacter sp.]|uniref:helix-turn-helix domain-containing protein n=1 Tax=Mucilaginibacter sp. TaxID=1882438 RepID=UPI003264EEBF